MTHTQLNAITSDVDRLQHSDFGNFHVHSLMSASSSSPQSSHDDRKLKVLLAVVEEYAKKALVLQDVAKSAIHLRGDCDVETKCHKYSTGKCVLMKIVLRIEF